MKGSREETDKVPLDRKEKKSLQRDLQKEAELDEKWAKLEQELSNWEKRNEKYFLDESLSKAKEKQLNRERKWYQNRFKALGEMYKMLLSKNEKEIEKVVSKHG